MEDRTSVCGTPAGGLRHDVCFYPQALNLRQQAVGEMSVSIPIWPQPGRTRGYEAKTQAFRFRCGRSENLT